MCVPCVESMNVACVEASPCIVRTTGIYKRYRESAMQAAMNVKWQKINDPFLTFEEQASFVLELLTNPEGMAQVRTLKQIVPW